MHDLVRETLYEGIPAARRLELHRTIGRVLQDVYDGDLESHLSELAHHFTEAAPLGLADEGIDYSIRAGDRAATVLAYEDAAPALQRALQLLPLVGGPTSSGVVRSSFASATPSGEQADTAAARDSFDECAESPRARARPRRWLGLPSDTSPRGAGPPRPRLGAGRPASLAAMSLPEAHGRNGWHPAAGASPDGPSEGRQLSPSPGLGAAGRRALPTDQVERRTVLSDQAIEMARRLNDQEALLVALHGRHWATFVPDQVDVRLANAGEMLRLAMDRGDDEMAFIARHARLHCCLELCDIEGVDAELAAMIHIADRIREPFSLWVTAVLRATRAIVDGRLHEAERLAREALAIGSLRESEYVVYTFQHAQIVTIRWGQGRINEVAEKIRIHGEQHG